MELTEGSGKKYIFKSINVLRISFFDLFEFFRAFSVFGFSEIKTNIAADLPLF